MKNSIFLKSVAHHFGLRPHSRFFNKGSHIAILRYHSLRVDDSNDYVSPNIALSPELFEQQIKYLSKHYNIISLDDVSRCLQNGILFPKKSVVITFDDGYRDNYTAFKILKKYCVSGTFYLVAGCIGEGEPLWLFEIRHLIFKTKRPQIRIEVPENSVTFNIESEAEKNIAAKRVTQIIKSNNRLIREEIRGQIRTQCKDVESFSKRATEIMLTWEQVLEMSENDMIIGGHTMTHLNLPNADPVEAFQEITDCKRLLEKKLQKPVIHFSYPNGGDYSYYNPAVLQMVKKAGYFTSTTSENGLATIHQNPFELHRIRVTPHLAEICYQIEYEPIVNRLSSRLT